MPNDLPPDWKDEAAEALYKEAGASKLVGAHLKMSSALNNQGAKMDQHFNTPYTEHSAQVMEATTKALVVIGDELRKWHELIYPNRPRRQDA